MRDRPAYGPAADLRIQIEEAGNEQVYFPVPQETPRMGRAGSNAIRACSWVDCNAASPAVSAGIGA